MVSGCVIGRYKNRRTPQDAWKSVMRCRAVFIHTLCHLISQLQSRVTFMPVRLFAEISSQDIGMHLFPVATSAKEDNLHALIC